MKKSHNYYNSIDEIKVSGNIYKFYNVIKSDFNKNGKVNRLPISYKILLENLIRNCSEEISHDVDMHKIINLEFGKEIQFKPSRVLMQDYTGVPAIADLAAMRDSLKKMNKDPKKINPLVPVSLVIDHSLIVDKFGNKNALFKNIEMEFKRNTERYQLLKWAQSSFKNFKVFPPGSGICHQINIEFLADVVGNKLDKLFFDTVVGTDSHTTMVNALSVLGWGVGGIEAEAVMLGQSISMLIPEVVGVKFIGNLREGITATDLVLTVTERLREIGVVGKFVEFFGPGLQHLTLSERSTISNMSPEYGATCGLFPVDDETIDYLKLTGRNETQLKLIKEYHKLQDTWGSNPEITPDYNDIIEIDLEKIKSSLAGPKRPQDRINLEDISSTYKKNLNLNNENYKKDFSTEVLTQGSVCIAAITSCTNTSNPAVLIGAGLMAKKARKLGIKIPKWVKTSFAPGSKVVGEYLEKANLMSSLNELGFNIVGYGCTTCIGNSGSLDSEIEKEIKRNDLNVCSVISGNRNFEGRIHPLVKSNFLASPLLVIAFAIFGNVNINFYKEPLFISEKGKFFLKDIWPSNKEIDKVLKSVVSKEIFKEKYSDIFSGDQNWKKIKTLNSETYDWSLSSTYIKRPPFLDIKTKKDESINNLRPLMILGDSVTTDHISPAGSINEDSRAGKYLSKRQINTDDFNSYGARRGNHEVMVRGTFANVRIKNKMTNQEGGFSVHYPSEETNDVFDVAEKYKKEATPLIVIAGKEYGTGSSRDWAAKGTKLLGVRVVLAETFERIHRSNLVGMGVLPLQIMDKKIDDLNLRGNELFDIGDLKRFKSKPKVETKILLKNKKGNVTHLKVLSRIDTLHELEYFKEDGILPYVMKKLS